MSSIKLNKLTPDIRQSYQKTPYRLRYFLSPIRFLYRLVKVFNSKIMTDVWTLSWRELHETPITIIFAGNNKNKNYLASQIFDNLYKETYIGKIWRGNSIHKIPKRRQDCSLLISEVSRKSYKPLSNKEGFFIPCWIGSEADISADISAIIHKKALSSDLGKMKKRPVQFEFTKEPYQFDNFYYTMYLPYINRVHENRVNVLPYEIMKKRFERCDLILMKRDNEYIAGDMILYEDGIPHLWFLGIKDGNTDYLKDRVVGIINHFAIEYLKQKGYKRIHFGTTRSFLNDSILQYKKNRYLQLQVTDSSEMGFLLKPLTKSTHVKEFFLRNPFIHVENSKFYGAVFIDSNKPYTKEDFEKIYKTYYLQGLTRLNIYAFGNGEKSMRKIIPPELLSSVSLQPAEGLFQNE